METSFTHTQILVHLHVNKTNFHMKGLALGLALKQRQNATRKSPIELHNSVEVESCQEKWETSRKLNLLSDRGKQFPWREDTQKLQWHMLHKTWWCYHQKNPCKKKKACQTITEVKRLQKNLCLLRIQVYQEMLFEMTEDEPHHEKEHVNIRNTAMFQSWRPILPSPK